MKGKVRNDAFFRNQKTQISTSLQSRFKAARAQGTLSLTSMNPPLQEIPIEVFDLEKFLEDGEKFWEFEPLRTLDVSFNKVRIIPNDICNLVDCVSLKLRDNVIEELPEGLFEGCISLKHLDAGTNNIYDLSSRVGNLIYLKELLLCQNKLTTIPDDLVLLCTSLGILDLQHNLLQVLPSPSQGWRTDVLLHLNVANNRLQSLPDCLSTVVSIEVFNCSGNHLKALPEFSNYRQLKYLDASQNKLTAFPVLPSNAKSCKFKLSHLVLSYNHIRQLEIHDLLHQKNALSELLIHNNAVGFVPMEIEHLQALKILDVSNNELKDLPANLGYMNALQHIKSEGNPIRVIRQAMLIKPTNELKIHLRTRGPSLFDGSISQDDNSMKPSNRDSHHDSNSGHINSNLHSTTAAAAAAAAAANVDTIDTQGIARNNYNRSGTSEARGSTSTMTQPSRHDVVSNPVQFRIRDITGGILDLSSLELRDLPTSALLVAILSVPASSTLTSLNMSNNLLTSLPEPLLQDLLTSIPSLRSIDVSGNKLSHGITATTSATRATSATSATSATTSAVTSVTADSLYADREYTGNANPHSVVGGLSVINISKNGLSGAQLLAMSLPAAGLTELVVNHNNLKSLPASFMQQLSSLVSFRCSYCQLFGQLEGLDFRWVPHLTNLDVSNNHLESLNNTISFARNLEYLSVENNNFREIPPEWVLACPKLKVLLVSGNPQRLIRSHILQQGSTKVIEWLRGRVPQQPPQQKQSQQQQQQQQQQHDYDDDQQQQQPQHHNRYHYQQRQQYQESKAAVIREEQSSVFRPPPACTTTGTTTTTTTGRNNGLIHDNNNNNSHISMGRDGSVVSSQRAVVSSRGYHANTSIPINNNSVRNNNNNNNNNHNHNSVRASQYGRESMSALLYGDSRGGDSSNINSHRRGGDHASHILQVGSNPNPGQHTSADAVGVAGAAAGAGVTMTMTARAQQRQQRANALQQFNQRRSNPPY